MRCVDEGQSRLAGAVYKGVNELADVSCIAPPGQEGCREATGWWFNVLRQIDNLQSASDMLLV